MECGSSLSIIHGDEMTKKTLISLILEKSADLREMCQLGHTMEVIYINKSVKYINIGVRVSPTVRNWVLHRGYVYIGNSCCPVKDRISIKQYVIIVKKLDTWPKTVLKRILSQLAFIVLKLIVRLLVQTNKTVICRFAVTALTVRLS